MELECIHYCTDQYIQKQECKERKEERNIYLSMEKKTNIQNVIIMES